mmetsp:Transcript_36540/g.104420  ORF Transcript_36540/g.104420 Transcript_36540/m.104420 type:complete len:220 (+) Transcript_36540:137-796(+)
MPLHGEAALGHLPELHQAFLEALRPGRLRSQPGRPADGPPPERRRSNAHHWLPHAGSLPVLRQRHQPWQWRGQLSADPDSCLHRAAGQPVPGGDQEEAPRQGDNELFGRLGRGCLPPSEGAEPCRGAVVLFQHAEDDQQRCHEAVLLQPREELAGLQRQRQANAAHDGLRPQPPRGVRGVPVCGGVGADRAGLAPRDPRAPEALQQDGPRASGRAPARL